MLNPEEPYYKASVEYLKMKPEDFPNEHAHLVERYQEYNQATQEKRGPNWLCPLTHHMLKRLRQVNTESFIAMIPLSVDISCLMKELPGLINQYEIAENWN